MIFGLFKKTDPVCGMKEEKGKGIRKHREWFCSTHCLSGYENKQAKRSGSHSCCH